MQDKDGGALILALLAFGSLFFMAYQFSKAPVPEDFVQGTITEISGALPRAVAANQVIGLDEAEEYFLSAKTPIANYRIRVTHAFVDGGSCGCLALSEKYGELREGVPVAFPSKLDGGEVFSTDPSGVFLVGRVPLDFIVPLGACAEKE